MVAYNPRPHAGGNGTRPYAMGGAIQTEGI